MSTRKLAALFISAIVLGVSLNGCGIVEQEDADNNSDELCLSYTIPYLPSATYYTATQHDGTLLSCSGATYAADPCNASCRPRVIWTEYNSYPINQDTPYYEGQASWEDTLPTTQSNCTNSYVEIKTYGFRYSDSTWQLLGTSTEHLVWSGGSCHLGNKATVRIILGERYSRIQTNGVGWKAGSPGSYADIDVYAGFELEALAEWLGDCVQLLSLGLKWLVRGRFQNYLDSFPLMFR